MNGRKVRIITTTPTIAVIGEMMMDYRGVAEMAEWVAENRPQCLPDFSDFKNVGAGEIVQSLFPHTFVEKDPFGPSERGLTDNELIPELAGRKCYDSFGLKAGRKENAEYLKNVLSYDPPSAVAKRLVATFKESIGSGQAKTFGEILESLIVGIVERERNTIPHASVFYHAKMTFFIGNISRRVSQELMRNYVGSNHDSEGSPSQESTRYTEHHGAYVAHPYDLESSSRLESYEAQCQHDYDRYLAFIADECAEYAGKNEGRHPVGLARKRIFEAAAQRHGWGFATSCIWSTNPVALAKLFKERDNEGADKEFQRFAHAWKMKCVTRWPNLFPQYIEEVAEELYSARGVEK